MKPLYRKIHSHFKLNGISLSHDELKEVAYSLIKEGETFEKEIGDFLLDWLDDSPTLQVHSSGSTGKPKPIMLQKRHMVNSALATGEFFGLLPGDTALLCLPATYIAGKMMLVRAMVIGLELDYVTPSSNPLDGIPNKTYTFGAMVPLQLENSLHDLDRINILIVGGAPLSRKVQSQVQDRARPPERQGQKVQIQAQARSTEQELTARNFSTAIFETYGMTETITHIALKKLNFRLSDPTGQGRSTVDAQVHNPSFKTLPNVRLSTDERGCLVIVAPTITDAPVVTNDVVELISKTEFNWIGRFDNVVNSGGVKLFPEQIEAKLATVIPYRFFVAGIPDEALGQKLVLVMEGEIEEKQLFQEIKLLKPLNKFEVPKEIFTVSEFQQTQSGKIKRGETLKTIFP
ncbi:O-succinylbenzoic acid--CoA ligase [Pricia antarctica]|uniref:O-succinylbenzoic acid--CoA ligase n=1 Tax=Pricia antarctica TaxID=641691 RepID=A0A1G7FG23_9FLAO|nr:AMP-binding protein [Pricia antarctica]SDE74864.1 O-succinylbenzoic acid--CoA ligase [Pricia antarctica]